MLEYQAVSSVSTDRWRAGKTESLVDRVAEEVPVAMVYNGISHAVMLASPQDLEDFGRGFSLTEGIVSHASQIYDCEVVSESGGISVQMEISSERMMLLKQRRRNMTGRTGCGLCGTESLQHAIRTPHPVPEGDMFPVRSLHEAFDHLHAHQVLQRETGATHAAAWVTRCGDIALVREDIGRHNALDKLIGALLEDGTVRSAGAVIVTSRASYEMVQKVAAAEIPIIAAISAPTGLAIRMASACNVTLLGFARDSRHTVYSSSARLTGI
jgi:FdhD protein